MNKVHFESALAVEFIHSGQDVVYKKIPFGVYSEAAIKTQGDYSLKSIVEAVHSLGSKRIRTLNPTVDLSDINTLFFSIYAGRTGSNIKIGLHDSGGTITEITPNIISANDWQVVTWDISAVDNEDKSDIDQIIITIVNADAENTFYIDDFKY